MRVPEVRPLKDAVLSSPWPNPFYRDACWTLVLPAAAYVEAGVYDIQGRLIRRLESDALETGDHSIVWDGLDENSKSAASGIYFLKVNANRSRHVSKVVRIRR